MNDYIDGFVFPVPRIYLDEYKAVAKQVARIWKEHGAIDYLEFVGHDLTLEGTISFAETVSASEDEAVVFGWVIFPSKEVRDQANANVPIDPRMSKLVEPLTNPKKLIFDASRMVYGGFKPLVRSSETTH